MTHSSTKIPMFIRSILAIGTEEFPRHLFGDLRTAGGVDHVLIHAFDGFGQVTLCLSVGMLGEAAKTLSQRYARGLYTMDPFYPEIAALRPGDIGGLLELEADLSWVFRSGLMDPHDITDIQAFGIATQKVTFYVQFLRVVRQPFTRSQTGALRASVDVIAEIVCKHSALTPPPPGLCDINVDALIESYTASVNIAGREEEICKGVIGGSSSIQIAKDLEISVNTVQTYRKRLYQRLGISTQHELFERVLSGVLEPSALAS